VDVLEDGDQLERGSGALCTKIEMIKDEQL